MDLEIYYRLVELAYQDTYRYNREEINRNPYYINRKYNIYMIYMRILELFSGPGSVGRIAKDKCWEVISLDLTGADINTDILNWDYNE